MKKKLVILILIFSVSFLTKASTVIDGHTFKPFQGKTVNLIQYTDYVTKEYDIIASSKIDSNGRFYFDVDLKKTQEAIIQIEYLIGIIYLDTNQKYTIYFPPKSEDGTYKLTRNNVNIVFKTIPENDINGLILEFDRYFDQFILDNKRNFGMPVFHTKLDSFKMKVESVFVGVNNEFFSKYVKFSIANLELLSPSAFQKVNKLSIYNTYIINRKVDLNHPTQMRFLLNFYEKALRIQIGKIGQEINIALTTKPSYLALDKAIKKDYFFKMKSIRELVITENLYTLYYDDDHYDPNVLIEILRESGLSSENPDIHILSQNIIDRIMRNKKGTKAYPFDLLDKNGKSVTLESLKGKYVYLNFWAVWNKESQAEMDLFKKLKADYGDFVEFVSINIDSKKSRFNNYIVSHQDYDWTMLHFGGNSNLLDQYEVYNIPLYILIDTNGNIMASPASKPSPDGNYLSIDKTFFDIKKKYTKKKKFNVGIK
ncbi:TlpA family protein disulfide reductase [Flavobacteriales bacterium]|nr:TlpA family protein disulfide reductase [Flavobacteriales bacterium]